MLGPDEIDQGPGEGGLRRDGSNVDGDQIHGHAPYYGNPDAADEGAGRIGKRTEETVGVTDPEGRDSLPPLRPVGGTITNGRWGVNCPGLKDFPL